MQARLVSRLPSPVVVSGPHHGKSRKGHWSFGGCSNVKPTILIATTARWFTTARLATALSNSGCSVDVVCPSGHSLRNTNAVRNVHTYHGLTPLTSFTDAIAATHPDLIIPADDIAVRHLHEIYQHAAKYGEAGVALRALIEKSMGAPESFPIAYARAAFINLAREEGVRAPMTEEISSIDELHDWIARTGLPMVLKANGTSSGEGVVIVRTVEEAERGFRKLQAPPMFIRAVKRAVVDQDMRLIAPVLFRRRNTVNAQAFAPGQDVTSLVVCWKGEVLAQLHFEVVVKQRTAGPASVMRVIDNPEMSAAAVTMVRRLNLSGFYGFDFMLEAQTENAHLIEMNPRPTQVGHLALGPGHDLPAALYAALTGTTVRDSPSLTNKSVIALFPQEWTRNPSSPYLESAYHDVPWEDPDLIRACVRETRKWSAFYTRKKWTQVLEADRIQRP